METSELLKEIRDTLDQMPSGAGKMTLKGDPGGFDGWVGSWTLHGLLRDVARQLEDLQEANEDLADELERLRDERSAEGDPMGVVVSPPQDLQDATTWRENLKEQLAPDRDLEQEVDDLQTDYLQHVPELTVQLNELKKRVESLEEARDRRDRALGTRLGEIERDIGVLRSQVGTLLEDLYARREAEREDEEGSPLPERFSIYALSAIPDVDLQSAEAIVDHYGFLSPEELYVLSNRYTLQKMDRVSASSEWAIWKYLDEKDPELRHG